LMLFWWLDFCFFTDLWKVTDCFKESSCFHLDSLFGFWPFFVAFDPWFLESAEDFFRACALLAWNSFLNIALTAALSWDWGIMGSLAIRSVASSVAVSIDLFSLNNACSALIGIALPHLRSE
jgi:hypothetical protein